MYLPWKWSYQGSTQNIKQCLVCCLLKSRTKGMEATQQNTQACTIRHTHAQKKNLYLEWNSIFLTPKVCTLLSTHSFLGSLLLLLLLRDENYMYSFVNGLPPCSHPRIRYSMKTWGILLWLLVSCFLWKIQPPSLRHKHTHELHRSSHTEHSRPGISRCNATFYIY